MTGWLVFIVILAADLHTGIVPIPGPMVAAALKALSKESEKRRRKSAGDGKKQSRLQDAAI
jgi:hypothetical protein